MDTGRGLLDGLTVRVEGRSTSLEVAAWLLSGMGASIVGASTGGGPFAAVRSGGEAPEVFISDDLPMPRPTGGHLRRAGSGPSASGPPDPGVPAGTWAYASGVARGGRLGGMAFRSLDRGLRDRGRHPDPSPSGDSRGLLGTPTPIPSPPFEAPGGGWVQADLGAPGDTEEFALLLSLIAPPPGAHDLAAAAQEWRLPVCEYRSRLDVGVAPLVWPIDFSPPRPRPHSAARAVAANSDRPLPG